MSMLDWVFVIVLIIIIAYFIANCYWNNGGVGHIE